MNSSFKNHKESNKETSTIDLNQFLSNSFGMSNTNNLPFDSNALLAAAAMFPSLLATNNSQTTQTFNQQLLANLASNFYLQQQQIQNQNIWSKLLNDLSLGSSLLNLNSLNQLQSNSPAQFSPQTSHSTSCSSNQQKQKADKNLFSINNIMNGTKSSNNNKNNNNNNINHISNESVLNLSLNNKRDDTFSKTKSLNNLITSQIKSELSKTSPNSSNNSHNQVKNNIVKNHSFKQNNSQNITNGVSNLKMYDSIEEKIRLPIKYGWKRETTVKEISRNGVKGDVIYYSPCSKKVRNFQEIDRYLQKYANDSRTKVDGVVLTKENFTFSSKYLVGKFLIPKDNYLFKNEHIQNGNEKELKFDIYSEIEILRKINELNPEFKKRTTSIDLENKSNLNNIKTDPDSTIKHKIDLLKNVKYEPESNQVNKQEPNLYNNNNNQKNNKSFNPIQSSIQHHHKYNHNTTTTINTNNNNNIASIDEQKYLLIEAKRKEKYLLRERKTRKRWFDFIMSHYTDQQVQNQQQAQQYLCESNQIDSQIEDMQLKHLKILPELIKINETESDLQENDQTQTNLNWFGDCLQVIEFLKIFGDKLKEENDSDDTYDFSSIQSNIELFRHGLENKSDKLRKEVNQLAQLLIRHLVQNNSESNLDNDLTENESDNDESNDDESSSISDESYQISVISKLELNESTFSEILRLYLKRSLTFLLKRRSLVSFQIDITQNLVDKLKLYIEQLELDSFDFLKPNIKAAILAHLCDELLQNTSMNLADLNQNDHEIDNSSIIVKHIDETIDKLNRLRQDKTQIDSKKRSSNKSNTDDKKIDQLTKKRDAIQKEYDECYKILRSGKNLGQDRFKRHYWEFNDSDLILVEADYDTNVTSCKTDQEEINNLLQDMIGQVESNEEEEKTVKRFGHLIENDEESCGLKIKIDNQDVLNLSFQHIELLIKHRLQYKKAQNIDHVYLSSEKDSSTNWWLIDSNSTVKTLTNSLSKRGFREKQLFKGLNKISENNFKTDQSEDQIRSVLKDLIDSKQQQQKNTSNISRSKLIYREKLKLLKQVYSLEDKVFNANLQVQNQNANNSKKKGNETSNNNDSDDDDEDPLLLAKNRLLSLEKRIEHRYLKYPFSSKIKLTNINLKNSSETDYLFLEKIYSEIKQSSSNQSQNNSVKFNELIRDYTLNLSLNNLNSNVSNELDRWRRLVQNSKTPSQLSLRLIELNKSIEWDKSIMKVICHICNMDNNEEKLLLCDNCDFGYHTYCFKPKIDIIPDGDWYCFMCISKFLNGKKLCCVCGRGGNQECDVKNNSSTKWGDLNKCEKCSKMFHSKCMPNAKLFKTTLKWHCLNCQNSKSKSNKSNHQSINDKSNSEEKSDSVEAKKQEVKVNNKKGKVGRKRKYPIVNNTNSNTNTESEPNKKVKKESEEIESKSDDDSKSHDSTPTKKKNSISENLTMKKLKQQTENDLYKCRILLNELLKQKSAWPFMDKVNVKDYPDYYKVIKEPIDFNIIKNKMKLKQYENKEEFAYDCRLIFDNCEHYNEDDSQIGQAGHKLRAFFETKWLRLFD